MFCLEGTLCVLNMFYDHKYYHKPRIFSFPYLKSLDWRDVFPHVEVRIPERPDRLQGAPPSSAGSAQESSLIPISDQQDRKMCLRKRNYFCLEGRMSILNMFYYHRNYHKARHFSFPHLKVGSARCLFGELRCHSQTVQNTFRLGWWKVAQSSDVRFGEILKLAKRKMLAETKKDLFRGHVVCSKHVLLSLILS